MALKTLMLRKKLDEKKAGLQALRAAAQDFARREAELEKSIGEAQTEEEKGAVEEAVDAYEREKSENEAAVKNLEDEIQGVERELADMERDSAPPSAPAVKTEKREDDKQMNTRTKFFGLNMEQRRAFAAREDVKGFLTRVREMKGQSRAVTGGELTIPEVMLDLMRDNMHRYSKLLKHVRVRPVKGTSRQNLLGAIPEAVWMEAAGTLNELEFKYMQMELDGYMLGGFIPISNALLEDSDENLASEIMDMLSQAIGLALDKAIVYGTGVKMPLGFVTRLAQAAKPASWGPNRPEWKDLRSTNLLKMSSATLSDDKFFKELFAACSAPKANYSTGERFWAMNSRTHAAIMAKSLTFNAAGAIVASNMQTMPVIGGTIEILEFIPDNDVVGGYGSLYTMAERSGASFASSEHVRFLNNQTLFKGVARYDGAPALGEGFVAFSISASEPTTSVEFARDTANEPAAE